jgi:hypothetical protein
MRCHAKTDRGVSKAEDRSCGGNQRWSSELRDRNEQASRRGDHALVVARELHILPLSAQELDRSEMQRIGNGSSARATTGEAISRKARRCINSRASWPC